MKSKHWLQALTIVLMLSCKKEITPASIKEPTLVADTSVDYVQYVIHKGNQYCDKSIYKHVEYAELKFKVKFDSSAIYTTEDSINQYDINKLYGFSDNNAAHQQFSARFGWRWSNGALRLFGYVYNDGIRRFKELGMVKIGVENTCSIKVENGVYRFGLNDKTDTLFRKSPTARAIGYRLYPYFGGDEPAPHDINIWIKELP